MGSFTQGGIALGQSLGGGIENYVAGRERRELLVGKALGIAGQLGADDKRTDEDNKLLKKLENVNELGTRQLQSLISEFETGEELQMMDMKRRLASAQTEAAEAKLASMKGLGDFTSKGLSETEAGFEGSVPSNLPEYLTKDYLAGDRGQMAAGAFPGEHYGDESKAVEYSVGGNPYLEETERRRAEDAEWFRSGQAEPLSAGPTNPSQGYNLQGLTNLGIVDANGNVQFSQKKYDDMFSPAALDETKRQSDNNYYRKKLDETIETIADMEGRSKTPSRDFAWYNKELENKDMYGRLIESTNQQQAPSSMPTEENPWPPAQAGEEGLDPVAIPNTMADAPSLQPEAEGPARTQQKLVGYETYGDGDSTPQAQLSDRMATRATGGTPATPVDERRGQLIDSLAQYNLTPTDRKQAIDMISEKYPKLKEFATTVITAGGEEIGYNVNGTIIKKQKGRVTTPQGWRVKSMSVNQSTGEETVIFENPKDLPSYVPTAAKYAETDPELTLTNENAPDSAQAKSFNEAAASSKGLIEDTRWMIEQTKKAGAIEQRMYPTFKAGIQTRLVAMRAQMRKVVVGTGSVSEFEQQMLRDAIPDSSDIFRWDSATIKRLESLGGMSERHVKYQGEAIGLWDYKPIGEGGQSGVGGTAGESADELGIL